MEKMLANYSAKILMYSGKICSLAARWDQIKPNEGQIVLNVDGAPVF